jgi:LAO/AO transport system kinase
VLGPVGGDDNQTFLGGLLEIADILVVKKSDRPDADAFVKNLRLMLAPAFHTHKHEIPIIKTVASSGDGIAALYEAIKSNAEHEEVNEKKIWLLTEKAWHLIQQKRMQDISKQELYKEIETGTKPFNLYRFVESKA